MTGTLSTQRLSTQRLSTQIRSRARNQASSFLPMTLMPLERALLRLLMTGYGLEDAAHSVGLTLQEANTVLLELQSRCGVTGITRLLTLAILKSWV